LDAGTTWTTNTSNQGTLRSVDIFDTGSAIIGIAVGDAGLLLYSPDAATGSSWNPVPENVLNGNGIYDASLKNRNLKTVKFIDQNTILVTCILQTYSVGVRQGLTEEYMIYLPELFNASENNVLDMCGNILVCGDARIENLMSIGYPSPYTLDPAYTLDVSGIIRGTLSVPSDYRIKTDIVPLTNQQTLDDLRPYQYYNQHTKKTEFGFLAHELQEIFPGLVQGEKDDPHGLQSVNYVGLIALLVKEIQELKAQIKLV
jgi:hypothetical protein